MHEITNMRSLRLKHNITLIALAKAADVSIQHISRMELFDRPPSEVLERKYEMAIEKLIDERYRAVQALERDYRAMKGMLLHRAEEQPNGL